MKNMNQRCRKMSKARRMLAEKKSNRKTGSKGNDKSKNMGKIKKFVLKNGKACQFIRKI
ncbi:MAG: hypothetical protein RR954_00640 [Christensenellaceae bacterium]